MVRWSCYKNAKYLTKSFFSVQLYSSYLQMYVSDLCLTKYRIHKVFQSKQINISLFAWQKNINVCNTKMNERRMDVRENNFPLGDMLKVSH